MSARETTFVSVPSAVPLLPLWGALLGALGALSCGSGASRDAGPALDGGSSTVDTPPCQEVAADGGSVDEHGFQIRVPLARLLPQEAGGSCDGPLTTMWDHDLLCTFRYGGRDAVVYVQSTPISTHPEGFSGAIYETRGAFWAEGGVTTEVIAEYDWGSQHHIDSLTVFAADATYVWSHSSFTVEYRTCHPPDCLKVYGPGYELVDDGCRPERTLPEVCVVVGDDGSYPPLIDSFAPCPQG